MRQSPRNPPIINAPPVVTALTMVIVAAHIVRVLGGQWLDGFFLEIGVVFPERFWGWLGVSMPQALGPYGNPLAALTPLVGTAFVHGDWGHLLMNSIFLIALGRPVCLAAQEMSQTRRGGNIVFLILFFACVAGGSLAFLVSHYPVGPPAIGASGGVSGLLAAVLLMQQRGGGQILERGFLSATGVFVVANIALAFFGPQLLGASIAWQAHLGGYATGALLFRWMIVRYARAGS